MNRREKILSALLNICTLNYYGMVEVNTSHRMVGYFCQRSRTASYEEFERAFKKVYWQLDHHFPKSLFGPEYGSARTSQFHGNLIQINGIGFILSPYGFFKANRLRKRTIKQLRQYQNQ